MKRNRRWIIIWPSEWLVALLAFAFIIQSACGPTQFTAYSRNECESCKDDSDCKKGMTCEIFKTENQYGGTMLLERCAYSYTYECD